MSKAFHWLAALGLAAWLLAPAPLPAQSKKGPGLRGKAPAARQQRAFEQFNRMSPEERRRLIERLPPERKKALEDRLEQYNRMKPEERQQLNSRLEEFRQLPADRQESLRRIYRRMNSLPVERREVMREEFATLRGLAESERRARMNSDEFRNRYTLAERQLLHDLSLNLPD